MFSVTFDSLLIAPFRSFKTAKHCTAHQLLSFPLFFFGGGGILRYLILCPYHKHFITSTRIVFRISEWFSWLFQQTKKLDCLQENALVTFIRGPDSLPPKCPISNAMLIFLTRWLCTVIPSSTRMVDVIPKPTAASDGLVLCSEPVLAPEYFDLVLKTSTFGLVTRANICISVVWFGTQPERTLQYNDFVQCTESVHICTNMVCCSDQHQQLLFAITVEAAESR